MAVILSCFFVLAIAVQLVYAVFFFRAIFSLSRTKSVSQDNEGVSIIICARNEAENLEANLPDILSQHYDGPVEVVVVDDASEDDTSEVLKVFKARFPGLVAVSIAADKPRSLKGKKYALSQGVAAARYDRLLLTDADCQPASGRWLQLMTAPLAAGKEIVAGYGGYYETRGLLNAFIRWETLHSFLQYTAYALVGRPYMAVGRNLACTKSIFLKAQMDRKWNAVPSGDDDLLVSICATKDNMAVVCDKEAFTFSRAKATWAEWARQKKRHLSTGKYYRWHVKLLLGAYACAHALVWAAFFLLLVIGCQMFALILMAARCAAYWAVWRMAAKKLDTKMPVYLLPLADIGWMIYNFVFFPYITWKNKEQWK